MKNNNFKENSSFKNFIKEKVLNMYGITDLSSNKNSLKEQDIINNLSPKDLNNMKN